MLTRWVNVRALAPPTTTFLAGMFLNFSTVRRLTPTKKQDSRPNVTTVIVAGVMFAFGTGAVKGFALVLIVEIVLSIATNLYFSHWLLSQLVKAGKLNKPKSFGVKESDIRAL